MKPISLFLTLFLTVVFSIPLTAQEAKAKEDQIKKLLVEIESRDYVVLARELEKQRAATWKLVQTFPTAKEESGNRSRLLAVANQLSLDDFQLRLSPRRSLIAGLKPRLYSRTYRLQFTSSYPALVKFLVRLEGISTGFQVSQIALGGKTKQGHSVQVSMSSLFRKDGPPPASQYNDRVKKMEELGKQGSRLPSEDAKITFLHLVISLLNRWEGEKKRGKERQIKLVEYAIERMEWGKKLGQLNQVMARHPGIVLRRLELNRSEGFFTLHCRVTSGGGDRVSPFIAALLRDTRFFLPFAKIIYRREYTRQDVLARGSGNFTVNLVFKKRVK